MVLVQVFVLVLVASWFGNPWSGFAKEQDKENAPEGVTVSAPEKGVVLPEIRKIDETGQKIGDSIDRMGQKASSQVGGWINTKVFGGITWLKLSVSLFLVFLVLLAERVLQWIIRVRSDSMPSEEGAGSIRRVFLTALSKPLSLFVWAYGLYWALSPLFVHFTRPDGTNLVHLVAQKAADIAVAFAILWLIFRLVAVVDDRVKKWAGTTGSSVDDMLAPLIGKTLRVFIIAIGSVIIIQNVTGVEIGPLLASLGVGGLAVALAARETIANFFGTLTILFDKPFQVGDRIVVNGFDGVVEFVGFRSARIRTLTGHVVSVPNEKLVNSHVENITKRPHLRWLTNIGVTYDTPPDKVEKAVEIIKDVLANHEGMEEGFPPRVAFNGFNDWSLNIQVFAWYHPPDYWAYSAWLQRTCLEIMRRFKAEGIDFAFPTRTVHLVHDDKEPAEAQ
jgi:MscS family membrane protein